MIDTGTAHVANLSGHAIGIKKAFDTFSFKTAFARNHSRRAIIAA